MCAFWLLLHVVLRFLWFHYLVSFGIVLLFVLGFGSFWPPHLALHPPYLFCFFWGGFICFFSEALREGDITCRQREIVRQAGGEESLERTHR